MPRIPSILMLVAVATLVVVSSCARKIKVNADEARAVAKEAYIYGFPVVEAYKVMYFYSVYKDSEKYIGPFNTLANNWHVYTPEDTTVAMPNLDTPYSMCWLDLRTEPVVITIPPVEAGRYFSVQLVDLYTHNFDYLGTRTTGDAGGNYMIVPPRWSGDTPPGIIKAIACETQFAFAMFRTQLSSPDDIGNAQKILGACKVQTLSAFGGTKAPRPPREMIFPPYSTETARTPAFFQYLNFALQFCPVHPSEIEERARFAKLGIEGGKPFNTTTIDRAILDAVQLGIEDGIQAIAVELQRASASAALFGSREFLKNNFLARAAAARAGLFSNSREEAQYVFYRVDANREMLDGTNAYTLRFADGKLPPVGAFWSITMYDARQRLVANPIQRYLVNSTMLPSLVRDRDGGVTLYVQKSSPGKAKEPNWLPAPATPFFAVLRMYLPVDGALDGSWTVPEMVKVRT